MREEVTGGVVFLASLVCCQASRVPKLKIVGLLVRHLQVSFVLGQAEEGVPSCGAPTSG